MTVSLHGDLNKKCRDLNGVALVRSNMFNQREKNSGERDRDVQRKNRSLTQNESQIDTEHEK